MLATNNNDSAVVLKKKSITILSAINCKYCLKKTKKKRKVKTTASTLQTGGEERVSSKSPGGQHVRGVKKVGQGVQQVGG